MIKVDLKNSLYPYSHFTEQLVDVFKKPPQKINLNHESSSFWSDSSKNQPGQTPAAEIDAQKSQARILIVRIT
jgi:hypothetical protein